MTGEELLKEMLVNWENFFRVIDELQKDLNDKNIQYHLMVAKDLYKRSNKALKEKNEKICIKYMDLIRNQAEFIQEILHQ